MGKEKKRQSLNKQLTAAKAAEEDLEPRAAPTFKGKIKKNSHKLPASRLKKGRQTTSGSMKKVRPGGNK
jgi:hypothetical protein